MEKHQAGTQRTVNLRANPVALAVRKVTAPSGGSVEFQGTASSGQTWDALEGISAAIRQEIAEMTENLGQAVELVRVAGGVNAKEFEVAVRKTNKDLMDFTTDFLKIADFHKGLTGPMKNDDDLAKCLEIYEKYMQFKALFNGVFHHTAILFTEFSLQAKDAMQEAMVKEAKDAAKAVEDAGQGS